ncbi:MAG: DUF4492 domain-containing protein [Bacteroides sp.]
MKNICSSLWNFYAEGFRQMTLGRTLWFIILLKLFIMFAILRYFFFPDILSSQPTDEARSAFVAGQLLERAAPAAAHP